jgi:hypothetical protein
MALRYTIEDGVVVLSSTAGGFVMLRHVLRAAVTDPAARPNMPLLIDMRRGPAFHYEDARWRLLILAEMREMFGSRWAILMGPGSAPGGAKAMFTAFSNLEGLDVGLFADKEVALTWLRRQP